jgi:hypothetical protein
LLAAQQVAEGARQQAFQPITPDAASAPAQPDTITIPKDTRIELIALETVSSATATVGSVVSFAVAKDVVVNGFTVAHAGTPVTGKITDVRRGSHETNRNGRLKIELNKLEEGKTVKLRLATIRWTSRICIRKALTDAAIWIVFFPFVLRLANGFSQDEKTGDDALLPRCLHIFMNVAAGQEIHPARLTGYISDSTALPQESCPVKGIGRYSGVEIQ